MSRDEFLGWVKTCPSKKWFIKNADCDHVTVCFPFVEDEQIDDFYAEILSRLRRRQSGKNSKQKSS
jgi:hypothetical protein